MFIAIADIDLFQLESVNDFLAHPLVSVDQLKQFLDDNPDGLPLSAQLEQFVLDHILLPCTTFKRESFRQESLVDLYASFLSDLLRWPSYSPKQLACILTFIQGLLCQIERAPKNDVVKLNEALVHSCSILMGSKKTSSKPTLFNAQQYPRVIDYVIQTIFQHRHLYKVLLDDKPQQTEKVDENRTMDFSLFEQPLFPCPLTEALPMSMYNEIILQLPPSTSAPVDDSDILQISRESTSLNENVVDLNAMVDRIVGQFQNITREQVLGILAEVSQERLSDRNRNIEDKLHEKERALLAQFASARSSEKNE